MKVQILFDMPGSIYGVFLTKIDAEIRKNSLKRDNPELEFVIEEYVVE
jgi:hypothetical protein